MNKQNIFCAVVYIILVSSFSSSFFSYTKSFKAPRIDAPAPSAPAFPVIEHNVDLAQTREITCKILDKVCELDIVVTVTSFESKCDMLITQTDIPLNITEPGLYCLMEDVTFDASAPAITIDADCVTIDLCQHAMDGQGVGEVGIEIVGGRDVITIHNGTIKNFDDAAIKDNANNAKTTNLIIREMNFSNQTGGSLSLNFCSNATVNNVSNILVEDCHFDQVQSIGICGDEIILQRIQVSTTVANSPFFIINPNLGLEQGQSLLINDCILKSLSGGVVVEYTQNVIIKNCEFFSDSGFVYNVVNCENVYVGNCIGTSSGNLIFRVVTGQVGVPTQMLACVLEDCIANDGLGFILQSRGIFALNNVKLINCCSNNSLGTGFLFRSSNILDNLVVENCVAQNSVEAGFQIETELGPNTTITNLEFNNCIAQQSGGDGFSFVLFNAADRLDHAVFKNCVAQTSLGNDGPSISYDGDGFAFGTSAESNGSFGDIIMIDCIAQNNADDGFEFDNTNTLIMKNCVANLNGDTGFAASGPNPNNLFNILLENCIAEANDHGFIFTDIQNLTLRGCQAISSNLGDGFFFSDSINLACSDCIAQQNEDIGFDLMRINNFTMDQCIAQSNGDEGIALSNCDNGSLINCKSVGNNLQGFDITNNSRNLVLKNCDALNNNSSEGILIIGGENFKCVDCSFSDNGLDGMRVVAGSLNIENIEIENCIAQDNEMNGFFFRIFSATARIDHIFFNNCIAQGNRGVDLSGGSGFNINGADSIGNMSDITFNACVAQNNADSGFDIVSSTMVVFKNCIAQENTVHGFNFDNVQNVAMSDCVSQQNSEKGFDAAGLCTNFSIAGCKSVNNNQEGFYFDTNTSNIGVNLVLNDCHAIENGLEGSGFDGFALRDIINLSAQNCVSLKNGNNGFGINNSTNATLYNCKSINNSAEGFLFNDPQNIVLNGCESINNGDNGINCATTQLKQDFTFIDCCSVDNGSNGFVLSTDDNDIEHIIFQDCVAQDNANEGFSLQCGATNNQIIDVIFERCIAQGNRGATTAGNGFDIGATDVVLGDIQNVAFEICVAQDNANDGFSIEDVNHLAMHNCVAQGNISNGFRFNGNDVLLKDCRSESNGIDGFEFAFVDGVSVQTCKALSNTGKGFDLVDTATGNFSKCRASSNGTQGFDLSATVTCIKIIDGCAVGNTTIGFEDNSPLGSNVLFGNAAFCNDVSNYAGTGINSVFIATGPNEIAAASRWDNVSA